jgi:Asp-tRNA(Asn)/Glu-tRNA(Gln) amidotransferase A subunit family amidase
MDKAELDLCYIAATEAITAFKAKKLSPVDLMKAMVARCEAVNPKVNAITYSFYERALDQARDAEAKYMKTDGRLRPLEGVPVAIKDFHPIKGEITTFGSRLYKDFRPDNTAPTVERLFDAGAIMHIRTTTPEFAHSSVTKSPLWGVTRNPWNQDYTAGGSSGGSGAAVASGMTTVADGTDGGGSIRIPASACGIVGYKAPFGRNPLDREHPFESLLHYGPMTRSVADAALLQNVMSGPHPADACTLREKITLPESYPDIRGWKVAFSMDLGYFEVDREVRKSTLEAIEVFKSLGCQVDQVETGWNWSILDAWMTHWEGLFAGIAGDDQYRWYEMDPFCAEVMKKGMQHSAAKFYRANLVRGKMYQVLAPMLDKYNILVSPTLAVPAVRATQSNADPDFRINDEPIYAYLGWQMTYAFNLVPQHPAMSIPSGFASTRVPTGLHIVSKTYDDHTVFQAAAAYEAAQPWRAQRPDL